MRPAKRQRQELTAEVGTKQFSTTDYTDDTDVFMPRSIRVIREIRGQKDFAVQAALLLCCIFVRMWLNRLSSLVTGR